VQAKEVRNMFNKIRPENFLNQKKEMPIKKPPGHKSHMTNIEPVCGIL
jgi:hypothetical protein